MLCDWHWLHWRLVCRRKGGGEAMEKEGEGEDTPADVPVYRCWYRLQVKWAVGRVRGCPDV